MGMMTLNCINKKVNCTFPISTLSNNIQRTRCNSATTNFISNEFVCWHRLNQLRKNTHIYTIHQEITLKIQQSFQEQQTLFKYMKGASATSAARPGVQLGSVYNNPPIHPRRATTTAAATTSTTKQSYSEKNKIDKRSTLQDRFFMDNLSTLGHCLRAFPLLLSLSATREIQTEWGRETVEHSCSGRLARALCWFCFRSRLGERVFNGYFSGISYLFIRVSVYMSVCCLSVCLFICLKAVSEGLRQCFSWLRFQYPSFSFILYLLKHWPWGFIKLILLRLFLYWSFQVRLDESPPPPTNHHVNFHYPAPSSPPLVHSPPRLSPSLPYPNAHLSPLLPPRRPIASSSSYITAGLEHPLFDLPGAPKWALFRSSVLSFFPSHSWSRILPWTDNGHLERASFNPLLFVSYFLSFRWLQAQ